MIAITGGVVLVDGSGDGRRAQIFERADGVLVAALPINRALGTAPSARIAGVTKEQLVNMESGAELAVRVCIGSATAFDAVLRNEDSAKGAISGVV